MFLQPCRSKGPGVIMFNIYMHLFQFGEQKHWTRWTYSEPDIKRSRLDGTPPIEDDKFAADRR